MTVFGIRISPFMIFLISVLLVGAAYTNFYALPLMDRVIEVESEVDLNRGRIEILDQTIADEKAIRLEIIEFRSELVRRGSVPPRQSLTGRNASIDLFRIARDTQSVIDDLKFGTAEMVFGIGPRINDGARMYRLPITAVIRGTGSNATEDVEAFLRQLEDRSDAAYFVEGFDIQPQPDPLGTPIRRSLEPEGPKVTISAALYYYGFPEFGSQEVSDTPAPVVEESTTP